MEEDVKSEVRIPEMDERESMPSKRSLEHYPLESLGRVQEMTVEADTGRDPKKLLQYLQITK